MRKWFTLLLILGGFATAFGQTTTGNFTFEGINRDYRVYVPPSYSPANPAPLVINMHGYTSNALQQEFYSGMNAVADTAGFVVCYPNGVNFSWNVGFAGAYSGGVNDVGFISALIDVLNGQYNLDLSRVYATGMSNGGFMSYRLACELDHRIAAIASVTGAMTDSMVYYCNSMHPVPVMEVHGTADNTVNFNGVAGFHLSTPQSVDYWVQENNCVPVIPQHDTLPDVNSGDNSVVTVQHWPACDGNSEVLLYKVENGGHTWPGASINIPGEVTNQDIHGSREIWEFFLNHSHPNPATNIASSPYNSSSISIYPNPITASWFEIEWPEKAINEVEMMDLNGRKLDIGAPEWMNSSHVRVQAERLKPGIYWVRINGNEVRKIAVQ